MFNVRLDLEYWPGGPIAAKLTKTSFFYRSVLLPGSYLDNVPLKYRALDLTSSYSGPVFSNAPPLLWMWFIRKGSLSIPLTQLQKFLYHNPSRSANGWIFTKYFFSESVCWAEDGCTLAAQIGGDFSATIVRRGNAWNDLRQFGFRLQWKCEEGHDDHAGRWNQGLVLAAHRAGQRDVWEHQDVSKRFKLCDPASPSSPSRTSSSNWLAGGWRSS